MSNSRFSYDSNLLRSLAERTLAFARAQGATAAEVEVSEGFGQSVGVRLGEIESIEYNRDKGITVTTYIGQRKGYASTSDFSEQALQDTVKAALSIAKFTAEDPAAGLADADLLARDITSLDLYHPWQVSVEQSLELAKICESAAMAVDSRITNSEGAGVSTQESHFIYANSSGFCDGFASSRHSLSCAVIAADDLGMQRDYWYNTSRVPGLLEGAEQVGQVAGKRAVRRLGGRKLDTQQVPVLFEAPLVAGIIGHLVAAASGGSLYRKSTFLLDSLGTAIFSPIVQLREDPHIPQGMASTFFDSEGVRTKPRDIVKDGVLQGYFLGSYSARKLGMQTTGNAGGNHNLILTPGEHDLQGLLRQMGTGLLVTELLGHGINLVTGDYSRGAAGFWVEGGEIQFPVEEITVAGNLKEMFLGIIGVGKDMQTHGSKQCGSLLVERMMVAGN